MQAPESVAAQPHAAAASDSRTHQRAGYSGTVSPATTRFGVAPHAQPRRHVRPFLRCTLLLFALQTLPAAASDCVILLHGLVRTSASMDDLAEMLVARGYHVANVDYPSREHPIEVLSEIAVGEGLAQCGRFEHDSVHFVTHSLGGILVRHYLTHHTLPKLGRVVMLAPPNQGSQVVDNFGWIPGYGLLNGPAGNQLGTDEHSVPRQLGAVSYPVGVIAGTSSINWVLSTVLPDPDDGKVSVEATKVAGMTDFVTLPVSHPFIMTDPDAMAQTVAFIVNGRFDHGLNGTGLETRGSID